MAEYDGGNIEDDGHEEKEDLGINPEQEAIEANLKELLPNFEEQANHNKSEVEKLARFFAELPAPDQARKYFFGFLNNAVQYGFFDTKDVQIMSLQFENAKIAYLNALRPWEFERVHPVMLDNIENTFYAILKSAIGTKESVQNTRTALNKLHIERTYGDNSPRRKGFLGRFANA